MMTGSTHGPLARASADSSRSFSPRIPSFTLPWPGGRLSKTAPVLSKSSMANIKPRHKFFSESRNSRFASLSNPTLTYCWMRIPMLQELNPGLVVLSITGFGHDGPEGARAGYDQIAQGEGGLMSLTGPDPERAPRVGVPISDLLAGMYGAYGVVAALHERNTTGVGRVVRTSLLAAIVGVHAFQGTRYTVAGEVPHAQGNHH